MAHDLRVLFCTLLYVLCSMFSPVLLISVRPDSFDGKTVGQSIWLLVCRVLLVVYHAM